MTCVHNAMVEHDEPGFAWKCAGCGYIFGKEPQTVGDEEAFRFNNRKTDDQARFDAVMSTVPGRRVTYRQLCEIDGCGFMGLQ
jgi:hypothetical protein